MARREYTNAREFDERVTLERKTETVDAATGHVTDVWTQVGDSFWVTVNSQKLSERLKEPIVANTLQSAYDYIVRMRSEIFVRYMIVVDDRFVWPTRGITIYLDIKDILDDQLAGRITNMACRRGLNNG